jgi:hypothetical protein
MFDTTLVFFFGQDNLSTRLSYVVTNMLTVVAFFFIVSSSLPQIPYLTLIDKYMNGALVYIVGIGIACVFLNANQYEQTTEEDTLFVVLLIFLGLSHLLLILYCCYNRYIEYNKIHINRHQVDILENYRLNHSIFGTEKNVAEEFLVHTAISDLDTENVDIDDKLRFTYTGTLRKYFQPPEAAGWLIKGKGRIEVDINDKHRTVSRNKVRANNAAVSLSRKQSEVVQVMSRYSDNVKPAL